MTTKTKGSKSVQTMENQKSQGRPTPRVTQQNETATTKKLVRTLPIPRKIQKLLRFKSPITFMSVHVVAKPPIAIA